MVAGDTFRAGAVEQIIEWGRRTDCEVVYKESSDPASVVYDGLEEAVKKGKDKKRKDQ